jgi:uncharacterized membrane protein
MPSRLDLPRHPVVHGHPIHAMLSDLPATLIPAALAAEIARRLTGDSRRAADERRTLSDAATVAALGTATAAALLGWIDWLTMPTEHPAQKPATLHGAINSAGLLALVGAVAQPRRRLPFLMFATAAVLAAGWIGGDLVFHYGWRVRPAEEAEIVEQDLAKTGATEPFDRAREAVSDFERRKTFLGR